MLRTRCLPPLLILIACGNGVSAVDSLNAELRVVDPSPTPEFFKGAEPTPDPNGPQVIVPQTKANDVQLGQINFQLTGELSSNAQAVAFQLQGDIGYWTLPASPNDDLSAPNNLAFAPTLAFNPNSVPPDGGMLVLNLNAIDGHNVFGPTSTINLTATSSFPSSAALVISLHWATEADLDLHVIAPSGEELWREKRTLYPAPPFGSPQTLSPLRLALLIRSYGALDFDSNANCVIDGRREENGVWRAGTADGGYYPPPGKYLVRVDTWSLCGQPKADYDVTVYLGGKIIAQTSGEALPVDTRFPNGAGSGLTVLSFDITPDGGAPDGG